jgi:hypothetical protein
MTTPSSLSNQVWQVTAEVFPQDLERLELAIEQDIGKVTEHAELFNRVFECFVAANLQTWYRYTVIENDHNIPVFLNFVQSLQKAALESFRMYAVATTTSPTDFIAQTKQIMNILIPGISAIARKKRTNMPNNLRDRIQSALQSALGSGDGE